MHTCPMYIQFHYCGVACGFYIALGEKTLLKVLLACHNISLSIIYGVFHVCACVHTDCCTRVEQCVFAGVNKPL